MDDHKVTPITCAYLDHGYTTQTSGPCCHVPIPGVTNRAEMTRHPKFIEIRNSMNQGQWHPDCHRCQSVEEENQTRDDQTLSQRQDLNRRHQQYRKLFPNKDFTVDKLLYLTVDVGRACNIQCRSCGPYYSSKWINEYNTLPEQLQFTKPLEINIWPSDNYAEDQDDFSNLVTVDILGGEPIYNIKSYGLLKRILDATKGQTNLHIITNGTLLIDFEKYHWLLDFNHIAITVSIDGIGSTGEFIRTGSSWVDVRRNIQTYQQTSDRINVNAHITHSLLNIFEITKIRAWCTEWHVTPIKNLTIVQYPKHLTYSVLTDSEKADVVQRLTNTAADYLIPHIENSQHDSEARSNFFKLMEHTLEYHNLYWRDLIPELSTVIKET